MGFFVKRWTCRVAFVVLTTISGCLAASAEVPVRLTFDSKLQGPLAPFVLAIDKGYYKAEGLDVTINTAASPTDLFKRVATGTTDMAFADLNSLIKFRDQNPDLRVMPIFMVYNRPPYAVIARRSKGISKPKDLEGKTVGTAVDEASAQWKIFVDASGIEASKVTVENVGLPVRDPMLAAGQVDAITGISFASVVDLKDRGVPADDIVLMLMSDYGVELYGNAIMVGPKFAAEKPEAVRGFLRAFVKSLKDTARHPTKAIDAISKRIGGASRTLDLERLQMALRDNILTPEVKANGYGSVDLERLQRAIDQIALTYKFKSKPKPTDVFDPSFLPSADERQPK